MPRSLIKFWAVFLCVLGGCAEQNAPPTPANVSSAEPNSTCMQIRAKMDALRNDGLRARVESAAINKKQLSAADINKIASLTAVNADYVALCTSANSPVAKEIAPATIEANKIKKP